MRGTLCGTSSTPVVQLTTGFYSAAARAAGELTPDGGTVSVHDASASPEFDNMLHPECQFGCFDLPAKLTAALRLLAVQVALHGGDGDSGARFLTQTCEQGALLFLRSVLLDHSKVPLFEWPHETPRVCERFGEAYASFAHTDLRVADLPMFNIWVPIADVQSEQLLLFAAQPDGRARWMEAADKAHHLPIEKAGDGTWYYFPHLCVGQALIFPGDGGHGAGRPGIFHCSAWETCGTRQSFDVREFVRPTSVCEAADGDERRAEDAQAHQRAADQARELLARQWAEWEVALRDGGDGCGAAAGEPGDTPACAPARVG